MEMSKVKFIGNTPEFLSKVYELDHEASIKGNKVALLLWLVGLAITIMCCITVHIACIVLVLPIYFAIEYARIKVERAYVHKVLETDRQRYAVYSNLNYLMDLDYKAQLILENNRFVVSSPKIGRWYFKEIEVHNDNKLNGECEIDFTTMKCYT